MASANSRKELSYIHIALVSAAHAGHVVIHVAAVIHV